MGIKKDNFYSMTWGEYGRLAKGYEHRELEKWRHTRALISAWSSKDMRMVMELPGDFDNLEVDTLEHKKEILHKLNAYKAWGGDKLKN